MILGELPSRGRRKPGRAGAIDDLPLPVTYVLPLRAAVVDDDLVDYVADLPRFVADVVVVDGSPPDVFAALDRRWSGRARLRHLAPAVDVPNGKVANVLTGLAAARHALVVLADDDVRWDETLLAEAVVAMGDADVARPQNRFDPAPWHARWDTARTLLNRAVGGGDWPGTLLVRRAALPHGYAGDCLFENLELVRTVEAGGGREQLLLDVIVPRRPPTTSKFLGQRVRQAYDELARPRRLVLELALLPALVLGRLRVAWRLAALAIGLAELGRRRGDGRGRAAWPPTAPLWAPAWVAERSVTAWLALAARATGGVRFGSARLVRAATPRDRLAVGAPPATEKPQADDLGLRDEVAQPRPRHVARGGGLELCAAGWWLVSADAVRGSDLGPPTAAPSVGTLR